VVQTVLTSAFSTTSTSYTDVTGLSVSITPKFSTSKILVTASIGGQDSSFGDCFTQLVRGSTAIGNSTAGSTTNGFAFASGASTAQAFSSCFVYLDSPATTSATTYKVQLLNDNTGTAYINRRASGADLGATPDQFKEMD
jgi:hypothetical protein